MTQRRETERERGGVPTRPHVLIVDDEQFIRDSLQLYFETNDFSVSTAENGSEALRVFRESEGAVDVVILDLVMPGMHGLELLRRFKEIDSSSEVIIATGCGSMSNAVEALRFGAFDYITKPILDFDEDLLKTVVRALETRRRKTQERLETPDPARSSPPKSSAPPSQRTPSWLSVYEKLNRVAALYGHRPVDEKTFHAIWDLLRDGFGADAAMVLEPRESEEWNCLRSWGFPSAPTPLDIWKPHPAGEREIEEEFLARSRSSEVGGVLSPGRTGTTDDPSLKWSKVLHVPFRGPEPDRRLLLLLFYRYDSVLDLEHSPVSLLAALLSWVFRHPSCFPPAEVFALANGAGGGEVEEPSDPGAPS